jgi:hypothetical protein
VKITGGVAVHTSRQITKHLLCDECEHRFKVREDYFYQLTDPSQPCRPIFNHLIASPNITSSLVKLIEIDTDKLSYFVISVIWRAHAMDFVKSLGSSEEATIKDYLMDRIQLPPTICIHLCVLDASPNVARPEQMFALPSHQNIDGYSDYSFFCGGLLFRMLIGESLPPGIEHECLVHAQVKYAVRCPFDLGGLMHNTIMSIANAEVK